MSTSAQPAEQQHEHADRRHPRTHLFVIATLYWASGSTPVHIRNMSPTGALVEGAALPAPGTEVMLKRGYLETRALVVWSAGRHAGISCRATLDVGAWMTKQVSAHQEAVDQAVRGFQSGERRDPNPAAAAPGAFDAAAELKTLRDELGELGNSLASDIILVATHPEIQTFDISLQRLERIMSALVAAEVPR